VPYHFDWSVLLQYQGLLWDGLRATVALVASTIALSLLLGTIVGLAREYGPAPLRWLCVCYTELFRNVPPIVQFFFWDFAAGLDVFPAALVGLSVFTSAYIAEVVRSGVQATPYTLGEAARCSGMSTLQVVIYIILPQAVLRCLPALGVEFINVIKNSAVAMTVGYTELTFQTQQIEAETFRGFEAATAVTVLYIALASLVLVSMHALERLLRTDLRRG
jgi:polar amino acid transport system permease protein